MVARQPQSEKPEQRVGRCAARQHGLLTRRQALACGLTPAMIRTRLRNGTFSPVLRGVYRLTAAPRSWKQEVLAIVLWAGDGAAASHGTAAKLWGFPVDPKQIEVTVGRHLDAIRSDVRVHNGQLGPIAFVDGIPTTSPARTLLDVADRVASEVLESMIDDAIARRLVSAATLEWELQISGGPGRYGSKALRKSMEHLKDGHCESHLETKVLRVLLKAGLPAPERQYEIRLDDRVARVDFAYPEVKLAIEVDGYRFHGNRKSFDADRKRDARLAAAGWFVIRVSDRTLDDHSFIAAVRRRLGGSLFTE